MSKGWFTLVAVFAISIALITGGFIKGRPELVLGGAGLGVFIYLVRNYLN